MNKRKSTASFASFASLDKTIHHYFIAIEDSCIVFCFRKSGVSSRRGDDGSDRCLFRFRILNEGKKFSEVVLTVN